MSQIGDARAGVLSPLVAPLLVFVQQLLMGTPVHKSGFTAVFITFISYVGFAVFVLPLHNYLKTHKKEHLVSLLVSGSIGGAFIVTGLYFLLALMLGSRENFHVEAPLYGALYGGLVAIAFCFLSGTTRLLPKSKSAVKKADS